ncbi:MAG: DNA cytosine methyltransferase [Thermoplasmatales archaeon]
MSNRSNGMKIIDLFCGTGGWVSAFPEGEYEIYGYDIEDFSSEYPGNFIQADLMSYDSFPENVLLVVASPPCTDFSKSSMPPTWKSVVKNPPDVQRGVNLYKRTYEIIDKMKPKYWIVENVWAAQKYVGKADYHIGSRYFWTNIPYFYVGDYSDVHGKTALPPSPMRPVLRSRIPYSISESLYLFLKSIQNGKS